MTCNSAAEFVECSLSRLGTTLLAVTSDFSRRTERGKPCKKPLSATTTTGWCGTTQWLFPLIAESLKKYVKRPSVRETTDRTATYVISSQVIKAYNRILDLKEKHVDVEVLTILVQAIVEERLDCHGLMVSRLGPATQKLLGRLTAQVPNNARVWEIYADLLSGGTSHEEVDRLFRVAQLLQKSYRSAVQQTGWDKDVATCCTAMQICIRFADACLACLGSLPASKETVHLCASAKLSLRSLVSQTRRCYDNHIPPEVDQLVRDLEQKLDSLTQTLSNSS